jgi:hypothetical protein
VWFNALTHFTEIIPMAKKKPFIDREKVAYTKKHFRLALARLLKDDKPMVLVGCHEQAICHRLAVYLEGLFPLYSIDCEYNRSMTTDKDFDSKELTGTMRPDTVIHERLSNDHNLFALEAKAGKKGHSKRDRQKIENLVDSDKYHYNLGALLWIQNHKKHLQGRGVIRIKLKWYEGKEIVEESVDPIAISEDEMRIVDQRK